MKIYRMVGLGFIVLLCCTEIAQAELNGVAQKKVSMSEHLAYRMRMGLLSSKKKKQLHEDLLKHKGDWYSGLNAIKQNEEWSDCLQKRACVGDILNEAAHLYNMRREMIALHLGTPGAIAWINRYRQYNPAAQSYLNNRLLLMSMNAYVDLEEVKKILEAGAQPNVTTDDDEIFDELGSAALTNAVAAGNRAFVSLLIDYGADVALCDPRNGYSSLDYAVKNNDLEMLEFLVSKGAKPGEQYNPLLGTVLQANPKMLKVLLKAHVCNEYDCYAALQIAREYSALSIQSNSSKELLAKHREIILLLEQALTLLHAEKKS